MLGGGGDHPWADRVDVQRGERDHAHARLQARYARAPARPPRTRRPAVRRARHRRRPPPARPARMAWPAAPRSSGCRDPVRYATWNGVQLGSTTASATPSPPSAIVRCAVAPACSASRRSAGSAASASSGWARRASCSTPAPRRSRPHRPGAPCRARSGSRPAGTPPPARRRAGGRLGDGQAAAARRRPGAAGAARDPGSAPSRRPASVASGARPYRRLGGLGTATSRPRLIRRLVRSSAPAASDRYPCTVTLRLYDTATRSVRDFVPRDARQVGVYLCGLTVQSPPHIGHLRSGGQLRRAAALAAALRLRRHVHPQHHRHRRQDPRQGDASRAARSGPSRTPTSGCWPRTYRALNVLPPTYEPRATGHIPEMHELIARADRRGHAYPATDGSGDVYFDVRSCAGVRRRCPGSGPTTMQPADGRRPSGPSATRATSRCGRAPSPTSRPTRTGRRRGAAAGPAGTSSARRCAGATSAPSSTSTAAGST